MPSTCRPDRRISAHARCRMAQRAVARALLDMALDYGRHDHAGGGADRFYFGEKEARRARRDGRAVRDGWAGTSVIVGLDGTIVTTVRRDRPPRR